MKIFYILNFLLFFSGSIINAQDVTFNGDLGPAGTGTIPDGGGAANQGIDAKCAVTGIGQLKENFFVKVTLDISHTYDSDLIINLISPSGLSLNLANRIGETGDNFKNTRFTQTATLNIGDKDGGANPPYNGEFLPHEESGLSKFNTLTADGQWTLHIQDNVAIDAGNLNKWSLTFNKNPIIKPTANFSQTANFLDVSFKNETSDTTVAFVWDFGDGDSSTLVSPMHSYLDSGTYTVKLFASNAAGQDSSIQEITVESKPIIDAIKENKKMKLSVFPNPFKETLKVNWKEKVDGNMEIRNTLGQLLFEKKINSAESEISLTTKDFPVGLYTVYFKTQNGISVVKVIK